MTLGPHLLGRVKEHDPQSRVYQVTHRVVARRSITHLVGPHLNQADLGSCEGNTVAEWLNWTKAVANRRRGVMAGRSLHSARYLTEPQAVDLYAHGTRRDEDTTVAYPPIDCGTSGLGVAKALQDLNFIDGYDWTFDFESFLAQLQRSPICLGSNWYRGMMETDQAGYVAPSPRNKEPDGGHAYLAHAVDFRHDRVGCTNHWINDDGSPWGVKIGVHPGSFWIRMPILEQLLIHEEGEAMVPRLLVAA